MIRPRPARFKDAWLPMCIVGFVIAAIIIGGALFIGSFRMGYVVAIAAACFVFQSFIGWIMYMRQHLHAMDGPYAVFTPSQKYVDLLHARGKPRVHYTSIRGFQLTFAKTSPHGDGPLYQVCAVDESNQSHLIFVTRWRGEFHRILRELEQHGMPMSDPPVVEPPRLVHDGEVVAG